EAWWHRSATLALIAIAGQSSWMMTSTLPTSTTSFGPCARAAIHAIRSTLSTAAGARRSIPCATTRRTTSAIRVSSSTRAYRSIDKRRFQRLRARAKNWTRACVQNGQRSFRPTFNRRPWQAPLQLPWLARRTHSRLGADGAAELSASRHNGCHDGGVPGAAANLTAELVSGRPRIRISHPQQDVARHHQHAGRAKPALQGMRLMEMPAQYFHCGIVVQPFERLHGTTVTHDRKSQARAGGLSVHGDRAGTAGSVFTPQMGCRQATPVAQEICKRFPRLHFVGHFGTIEFKRQGLHLACTSRTARRTVEVCKRMR